MATMPIDEDIFSYDVVMIDKRIGCKTRVVVTRFFRSLLYALVCVVH